MVVDEKVEHGDSKLFKDGSCQRENLEGVGKQEGEKATNAKLHVTAEDEVSGRFKPGSRPSGF